MNVVKDYILEHGFESLSEDLGIKVKEYENFYCLDYSQIDSPKTHPVVMECRGAIIDKISYNFLCRPFKRFFNYGEGGCPEGIDFNQCVVHEKIDGSLIKVWYNPYSRKWEVGTRGTAFAEGEVGGWGVTFRELFFRAAGLTEERFQDWCNFWLEIGETHLFELACRENRVVTPYTEDTLVYLGHRIGYSGVTDTETYDIDFNEINARVCKSWHLGGEAEIKAATDALEGLEEGFVVYRRGEPVCKIKTPLYVAVHRIRGEGLNPKRIVDLLWEGEYDEYITYFPEDKLLFEPYQRAINKLHFHVIYLWEKFKGVETQKEFALGVKDYSVSGLLFSMRKGDTLNTALGKVSKTYRLEMLEPYLENDV